MCDSRGEKFVVPVRPAAEMGWWLGQVLGMEGRFYGINILWVQIPAYSGSNVVHSTKEYLREFDTVAEATDYLRSVGAMIPSAV